MCTHSPQIGQKRSIGSVPHCLNRSHTETGKVMSFQGDIYGSRMALRLLLAIINLQRISFLPVRYGLYHWFSKVSEKLILKSMLEHITESLIKFLLTQ